MPAVVVVAGALIFYTMIILKDPYTINDSLLITIIRILKGR